MAKKAIVVVILLLILGSIGTVMYLGNQEGSSLLCSDGEIKAYDDEGNLVCLENDEICHDDENNAKGVISYDNEGNLACVEEGEECYDEDENEKVVLDYACVFETTTDQDSTTDTTDNPITDNPPTDPITDNPPIDPITTDTPGEEAWLCISPLHDFFTGRTMVWIDSLSETGKYKNVLEYHAWWGQNGTLFKFVPTGTGEFWIIMGNYAGGPHGTSHVNKMFRISGTKVEGGHTKVSLQTTDAKKDPKWSWKWIPAGTNSNSGYLVSGVNQDYPNYIIKLETDESVTARIYDSTQSNSIYTWEKITKTYDYPPIAIDHTNYTRKNNNINFTISDQRHGNGNYIVKGADSWGVEKNDIDELFNNRTNGCYVMANWAPKHYIEITLPNPIILKGIIMDARPWGNTNASGSILQTPRNFTINGVTNNNGLEVIETISINKWEEKTQDIYVRNVNNKLFKKYKIEFTKSDDGWTSLSRLILKGVNPL